MIILHRILGIYRIIIIVWAVMTWIPGISGSALHNFVGIPVVPVLNLFSFATIGFIGIQAIILLGIIWGLETLIENHLKTQGLDVFESGGHGDDNSAAGEHKPDGG